MKLKALILIPAAACTLAIAGCSSDDTSATTGTPESTTTCPTSVPDPTTQADWVFQGTSGSIEVVAPTPTNAPLITVNGDFSVNETTVKTLTPGTGAEVTAESYVTVCYHGVLGRDGATFDDSFSRGAPEQFSPMGVVPGFRQALIGQKVGSKVAVAIPPADGYGAAGSSDGTIKGTDTIVFALSILDAS
ncbi:peptidyl-prolyl cis-trans isomerase [Gordonia spumicola]|uniref:Peptidyl-prolyl cis-trans isomerase n=1 Tax=Gordonia spumicola TaxID=589161 RepID=A0A7I9VDX0_9ACTN|nr:FKBP-type peptidyl-prolyl cis-trans isomerase [Gordonia spumicola]GEE03412.1 peptidyl-prolyl cis-trans isomerase [Gordonia spumicola]